MNKEQIENVLCSVAMAADLNLLDLEKMNVAEYEDILNEYIKEFYENIENIEKLQEIDEKYTEILLQVA